MVEGMVLPDTLPILDNPAILPNQNFQVLGLGRCSVSGSGKASFDLNPETVRKSFGELEHKILSNLTISLNSFYNNDKNTYTKNGVKFTLKSRNYNLHFKIVPEVLPLNKTEFTYIYKFQLELSDGDIRITINDKLGKLLELLKNFRTDLVKAFNGFIEPNVEGVCYPRTEEELSLTNIERIYNNCKLSELQKKAPVVSALNGKFQLSHVDAKMVRLNNLGTRCINVGDEDPEDPKSVSGKFNDAVYEMYCGGMNDYDIALDFGVMNLITLSNRAKGKKARAIGSVVGSLARDAFWAFVPGFNWANDVRTALGPGGYPKTQGIFEAVGLSKVADQLTSRPLALADLGLTAKLTMDAIASGGIEELLQAAAIFPDHPITGMGAILGTELAGALIFANGIGKFNAFSQWSATIAQSRSIYKGRLSLPQAMLNVLEDCRDSTLGHQALKVPSKEEQMEIYGGWQTSDGKNIAVGVSESRYEPVSSFMDCRRGQYEDRTNFNKRKGPDI